MKTGIIFILLLLTAGAVYGQDYLSPSGVPVWTSYTDSLHYGSKDTTIAKTLNSLSERTNLWISRLISWNNLKLNITDTQAIHNCAAQQNALKLNITDVRQGAYFSDTSKVLVKGDTSTTLETRPHAAANYQPKGTYLSTTTFATEIRLPWNAESENPRGITAIDTYDNDSLRIIPLWASTLAWHLFYNLTDQGRILTDQDSSAWHNQFGLKVPYSGATSDVNIGAHNFKALGVQSALTDSGGQIKNVKAYGAKGDGATNDAVAIQAALNAGGRVYLPNGTYFIDTTTITIPNDSTILEGESPKARIRYIGSGDAIQIVERKEITLCDLTLDLLNATGNANGINAKGVWFLNLNNVTIAQTSATMAGIQIQTSNVGGDEFGSYISDIKNCNIGVNAGGGRYGIRTFRTPGDHVAKVTQLTIEGGWYASTDTAIRLTNTTSTKLFGTAITNNRGDGINIDSCVDATFIPGEISSNGGWGVNFKNSGIWTDQIVLLIPSYIATGGWGASGDINTTYYTPTIYSYKEMSLTNHTTGGSFRMSFTPSGKPLWMIGDYTGDTAVFVDSTGFVSLGTGDRGGERIEAIGTGSLAQAQMRLRTQYSTATGGGSIVMMHNNGKEVLPNAGDRLGLMLFGSMDTNKTGRYGGSIAGYAAGAWTHTSTPGYFVFTVTPTGSTARDTALRVNSDKSVEFKSNVKVDGALSGGGVRQLMCGGVMDSIATNDTIKLGWVYPAETITQIIYDGSPGLSVTARIEMVDSLYQISGAALIDSGTCTKEKTVRAAAVSGGTFTLTTGKLLRMVFPVVGVVSKHFSATILGTWN